MSGIAGILNLDGAPVDRLLVQQMASLLAYRGPDAQRSWIEGPVGFAHALLRTTPESRHECQPFSLDGQVWITADARVDGRAELLEKLASHGRTELAALPDAALILHAYDIWGEDCVQHLIGDFAFAVWDGRRRCLFAARDPFGVKPFYYARRAHCLVFSNTLECVRLHPDASDRLNEWAIGDFLLADFNQETATTSFADIQRLPPGHSLSCSADGFRVKRYWTLPTDGPIHYQQPTDYVEHFKELLRQAVEDRLRSNSVGVLMSGGLDSTSVAATAQDLLAQRSAAFDLRAYTIVYDRLIPDEERHYARLVAEGLGIPIHFLLADGYRLYERWDQPVLRRPEPTHQPLATLEFDLLQQVAACSRVVLTGYGGDPALFPPESCFVDLLKSFQLGRFAAEVGRYVLTYRRRPPLWIRTALRRWLGKPPAAPPYPPWLNRAFAERLDLLARWRQLNAEPAAIHPLRPQAYAALANPFWPHTFENYDAGVTQLPLEVRHPFFDVRLISYLLALPSLPWCLDKELLRRAQRGSLPEAVRRRPKTPLTADPLLAHLRQPDMEWLDHVVPVPALADYVDTDAVPPVTGEQDPERLAMNLRPLSLNYWLQGLARAEYKSARKECYEVVR